MGFFLFPLYYIFICSAASFLVVHFSWSEKVCGRCYLTKPPHPALIEVWGALAASSCHGENCRLKDSVFLDILCHLISNIGLRNLSLIYENVSKRSLPLKFPFQKSYLKGFFPFSVRNWKKMVKILMREIYNLRSLENVLEPAFQVMKDKTTMEIGYS